MTPEERLKQKAKKLIRQGCTIDKAIKSAAKGTELANKADKLRNIKQQIEWDMRFGR